MSKYRTIGIGKNKEIKKQRMRPLPLTLMKIDQRITNAKFTGLRIIRRIDIEDKINNQDIRVSEDASEWFKKKMINLLDIDYTLVYISSRKVEHDRRNNKDFFWNIPEDKRTEETI